MTIAGPNYQLGTCTDCGKYTAVSRQNDLDQPMCASCIAFMEAEIGYESADEARQSIYRAQEPGRE